MAWHSHGDVHDSWVFASGLEAWIRVDSQKETTIALYAANLLFAGSTTR